MISIDTPPPRLQKDTKEESKEEKAMRQKKEAVEALRQAARSDLSFWAVIAGNFLSIFLALFQSWDIGEVMWIYWFQSVLIGFFNYLRILSLKGFSTENFKINNKSVEPTRSTKITTAHFFLIHYGFFHLIYAGFLSTSLNLSQLSQEQTASFLLAVFGFLAAHGFSFGRNWGQDFKDKKPNIGLLMFYPYIRIFPMHLTIILGSAFMALGHTLIPLLFFMLLKTGADAVMHVIEHKIFQSPENILNQAELD